MKIVVTTPTGNIGSKIVLNLIRAGVRPTVIARDSSKIATDLHPLIDIVTGDLHDAATVEKATVGADALFWLSPPRYDLPEPVTRYRELGKIGAEAVRKNGVPHVVHLSSIGGEHLEGIGLISGLAHNEVSFNETNASVRHLRPGFFYENFFMQLDAIKNGQYYVNMPLDRPVPFVATRDIADAATGWLLRSDWTGKDVRFLVGEGPLTVTQALAAVSEGIGKVVTPVQIPDEAVYQTLVAQGGNADFATGYVEMMMGLQMLPIEAVVSPASNTATTLSEWAFSNLRPLI